MAVSEPDCHAIFDSIKCTESPYQNLIISLTPSEKVELLQAQIQELVKGYIPKNEYHISLMYGNLSCVDLEDEITELQDRLPDVIQFSKLRAVQLGRRPVAWNTLWEQYI